MTDGRLRLLGRCACLVVLLAASATSTQDYAELVARLYRQAVRNNKPLVVVLDQNRQQKAREVNRVVNLEVNRDDDSSSSSSSNEEVQVNELSRLLKQLQQKLRNRALQPVMHEHGKLHNYNKYPKAGPDRFKELLQQFADKTKQQPRYKKPRYLRQPQQQRYKYEDTTLRPRTVLRDLLSLRNSLSCNALDQCKRECNNNRYLRRKTGDCKYKCEITFTCKQVQPQGPVQPSKQDSGCSGDDSGCEINTDTCEGGDDSCGDSGGNNNPSTRAPPFFDSCNPNASDNDC